MGPPGCGKGEQAKKLAAKFKLQYVNVDHMIKDLIRTEGKSEKGKDLQHRVANGESCNNS